MTKKSLSWIDFARAQNLDIDASSAVFVGDTPSLDVKGPRNAGIRAILIERRPMENIAGVKPDRVIRSLMELLVVLRDC
jgi:FMN phosphatase YigB (HAD superfamily)